MTTSIAAIDAASKANGVVGSHVLRAVARVPEWALVAIDELHGTLNCFGKKFGSRCTMVVPCAKQICWNPTPNKPKLA
jgi:hypothetical protein